MAALRQMMRAFKGTGGSNAAYYPLMDLGPLLMFEVRSYDM